MLIVHLPTPPSLNNAYSNVKGRGRVKSAAYKKWRDVAALEVTVQRHTPIPGRVVVDISVPRSRGDIDNRIKPVLDVLVACRLIDDDSKVERVSAQWVDGAEQATAEVRAA